MQRLMFRILQIVSMIALVVAGAVSLGDRKSVLSITFLDIGQGDAIFIETPGGVQMLIDGGSNQVVLSELGKEMSLFDKHIDVVLATHPDADHIGGIQDVLRRFRVDTILDTGFSVSDTVDRAYVRARQNSGAQHHIVRRGERIVLDEEFGVVVDILFPGTDDLELLEDTNDTSVILVLRYGDFSMLLSGDAGVIPEQFVAVEYPELVDVTALKLGHHGSDTSTSAVFLGATSPEVVFIQAGVGNRYGHPHASVIQQLEEAGIPWHCTCEEGAVTLESDGVDFWIR